MMLLTVTRSCYVVVVVVAVVVAIVIATERGRIAGKMRENMRGLQH